MTELKSKEIKAAREEAEEKALYNTVEEERILLKYLFTQHITARKYFSKVNEEVFTSPIRIWLFRRAKEIFRDTKSLFDEATIKAELDRVKKITVELTSGKKIIKKNIDHVKALAEWNLTYAIEVRHTPEWLIEDLAQKKRAKDFMESTEKAVEKVLEGKSDDAICDLNSDLMKIRSSSFADKPLRRLSDASWQVETFINKQEHPERYAGIPLGFKIFDSRAGAFRGELILITAHTGVGKSTLMRSMALGAAQNGANVLFIVNEEIEDQAGNKFGSMIYTDIEYRDLKSARPTDLTKAKIKAYEDSLRDFGEANGEVFIQELPQFHTCAEIEEILVNLEQQGEKIDLVILDYLDHLKPMEKSWSDIDAENKAIAEFKNVCMQFRVAGITATQADTASVDLNEMNAYNVRGSKQKSGAANIVLAIKEIGQDKDADHFEKDDKHDAWVAWKLMITKNRDGGKCNFYARFNRLRGTVHEYDPEISTAEEREILTGPIAEDKEASKSKSKKGKGRRKPSAVDDSLKDAGLPKKEEKESSTIKDSEVTSLAHGLEDPTEKDLPEVHKDKEFKDKKEKDTTKSKDSKEKPKNIERNAAI